MAALALWHWYTNTGDVILATATTNYAIQNLAKTLFKYANNLPMGHVLFLQSMTAELVPASEEDGPWRNCRIPELLQYMEGNKRQHEKGRTTRDRRVFNQTASAQQREIPQTLRNEKNFSLPTPRDHF